MKLSQRERLYKAMVRWAEYWTAGRAPSTLEAAEDEVFEIIAEVEHDAGRGFSQLDQVLDFLKDDFGEFLLIARLADKERHVVLAIADDDEGYERLGKIVRKYAAGELDKDQVATITMDGVVPRPSTVTTEEPPNFADIRMLLPPTGADVKRMIDRMLSEPCPECGAPIKKKWIVGVGIDLVCTKAGADGEAGCAWSFPVDTGPFPISGRRVD